MSAPIRSGFVNWVDGMKMSKTHLLQLQQAIEDRLKDMRQLHDPFMDHGLLSIGSSGEPALDLSIDFDGRAKYQVELRQCRAITASGQRIEHLSTHEPLRLAGEVPAQLLVEGDAFDVVLRASHDLSTPYGRPDPDESPIRHPFIRASWTLELAAVKDLVATGEAKEHLTLARLRVEKEELRQDPSHIPASLLMSSMPQLVEFMREYIKFLKDTERDLMRIVVKLNAIKGTTELQESVGALCHSGLRFLETGISPVAMVGTSLRPREVVVHAAQFARTLQHATELRTGRGKDALLEYIREHSGISASEHMATLSGLTDLHYDHADLRRALGSVSLFCRTHKKLFDRWVDLDYIGQKKDKDIFIAQENTIAHRTPPPRPVPPPVERPQKPDSGWDF